MQISYALILQEEAYRVHRNRRALRKWSRRIFIWTAGLGTAIVLLGFLIKPSAQAAKALAPFCGLVVLWAIVLWVVPWWVIRRQFLGQPGARGPRTLTLDYAGAHWRRDGGSSDVEWKNYIRAVEGNNLVLLYTSPACFNIVPKRTLAAEQLDTLRELLKQNIPNIVRRRDLQVRG